MLTLVAVVLAYDLALDICDLLSSIVEVEAAPRVACLRSLALSLKDKSCTRLEKDILRSGIDSVRVGGKIVEVRCRAMGEEGELILNFGGWVRQDRIKWRTIMAGKCPLPLLSAESRHDASCRSEIKRF